jgi:hypothetical protein
VKTQRRRAALALAVLCLLGCGGRDRTWRELLLQREVASADLTRAARLYLEARPEVESVAGDGELGLRVKLKDREEQQVNLANLLRSLGEPMARPEQLERFLASVLASPSLETVSAGDRARLLPVVKDTGFLREVRAAMSESEPLSRPLAGDLVVLYVLDSADSMRYVDARALSDLQLSPAAVPSLALENLRAQPPEHRWEENGALRHLRADGNYEASFLLLPEFWDAVAGELGGEPLVAVPARGELAVAPRSEENAAALRAWARATAAVAPYPMSERVLVWRGGAWVAL